MIRVLGLNATTPRALEQDLRIFADGDKQRSLDRTSLGLQNALYLTLLALFLEKQEIRRSAVNQRFIPIIALEEPEAHLHPHLTKIVKCFLDKARQREQPVIISTDSTHLASSSNIEDLVLVKNLGFRGCKVQSASAFIHSLSPRDRKDLNRFLDITKSEMLFSKGVIFVEGDTELLLVSEFAKIMGKPLDKYGVALCNAYGTHFNLLVTLAYKFGIPFLVFTDGDPQTDYTGRQRGIDTLKNILPPELLAKLIKRYQEGKYPVVDKYLRFRGIYINEWTLEPALIASGLYEEMKTVFSELGDEIGVAVRAGAENVDNYLQDPTTENMEKILKSISDTRWGKGRFSHRLVDQIHKKADNATSQSEKDNIVPEYIRSGIDYIVSQVEIDRVQI